MLLLKRLLTFFVLVPVLWIAFSIGALAVVGGVAGAQAARNEHATNFQSGYAAGHAAGQEVGRKYGPMVLVGSLGVSAIASLGISFSGVLPWCRRRPQTPPPLPI
jgi:hypothetical protein